MATLSAASVYTHFKASGGMATLGLEIVVSIVFGFMGGGWLDDRFATTPVWTIVGLVAGMGAAVRFVHLAAQRAQKGLERDGFRASQTNRPARFAMSQRDRSRHG